MIDYCDWNRPGYDRYIGPPAIPISVQGPVRAQLSSLIERKAYTDLVTITRDNIASDSGTGRYGNLREMVFGTKGRVCKNVTRVGWSADNIERAMVFCASMKFPDGRTEETCVIQPSVCSNWALVSRLDPLPTARAEDLQTGLRRAAEAASAPNKVNEVPEPSSWMLVLLAMIVMVVSSPFRKKG